MALHGNPNHSRWELVSFGGAKSPVIREMDALPDAVVLRFLEVCEQFDDDPSQLAPKCYKPLAGTDLHQFKIDAEHSTFRFLFAIEGNSTILLGLHAFEKKSKRKRETPQQHTDKATDRLSRWRSSR